MVLKYVFSLQFCISIQNSKKWENLEKMTFLIEKMQSNPKDVNGDALRIGVRGFFLPQPILLEMVSFERGHQKLHLLTHFKVVFGLELCRIRRICEFNFNTFKVPFLVLWDILWVVKWC